MAQHKVKCCFCNIIFDANAEPFVKVGSRRYAHQGCVTEEKMQEIKEEQNLKELEEYIKIKFNIDVITAKIKKQIRDFKKEYNYTYSGMLKSLMWWFDIKKNSTDNAKTYGGIGIIPFIYDQSKDYYERMWLIEKANELSEIKIPAETKATVINIEPPQPKSKKVKLFNI